MADKPTLHLTSSSDGPTAIPTLANLIKLFRKLTGKDPTPSDLAAAQARIDRYHASK